MCDCSWDVHRGHTYLIGGGGCVGDLTHVLPADPENPQATSLHDLASLFAGDHGLATLQGRVTLSPNSTIRVCLHPLEADLGLGSLLTQTPLVHPDLGHGRDLLEAGHSPTLVLARSLRGHTAQPQLRHRLAEARLEPEMGSGSWLTKRLSL